MRTPITIVRNLTDQEIEDAVGELEDFHATGS